MKHSPLAFLLPGTFLLLAVIALVAWNRLPGMHEVELRVPGRDRSGTVANTPDQPLVGQFTPGSGRPAALTGNWSHFRGERFDGIAHNTVPLARSWPEEGPKRLWSIDLGEGHAGAAIRNGRVYLLDYDAREQADVLRCLSLADGRQIWQYAYPVKIKRSHGMSRTIPAVSDQYVVTLGPKCQIMCLDAKTGDCFWLKDLVRDYDTTVPQWYAGQCPFIDGERAIFAPGGDALMIALDCRTGELVWKCPNPRHWKMTHSSIMPMEFAGKKLYVFFGSGGVAVVSADDGKLLCDSTAWKVSIATCPSPVILPEGRIFCCGGYNSGAAMLQLVEKDGKYSIQEKFRLTPKQFGSTQQTPIFYDNHLFGVREQDKQLVCLDLDGNEVWRSGTDNRFGEGRGPYFIADGLLFLLDDHGRLTLAEATPAGYHPLAHAKILNGHDAWAPMALAAGRLLLRDLTRMVALDVAKSLPQPSKSENEEPSHER